MYACDAPRLRNHEAIKGQAAKKHATRRGVVTTSLADEGLFGFTAVPKTECSSQNATSGVGPFEESYWQARDSVLAFASSSFQDLSDRFETSKDAKTIIVKMGPKKMIPSPPFRVRVVSQINGVRRLEDGTVMYHVSGRRFREGQDDWRREEDLINLPRFPEMLAEFRERTRGLGIVAEEAAHEQERQEAEPLAADEGQPPGGVALNALEGPALAPAQDPGNDFKIHKKITFTLIALLVFMIAVLLACEFSITDDQFYVSCGQCICNKWTYEFSHWY